MTELKRTAFVEELEDDAKEGVCLCGIPPFDTEDSPCDKCFAESTLNGMLALKGFLESN